MAERITNQRAAILELLKHNKAHPTANQVYEQVREKLPHISKGTIYRNLENLQEEGLVRAVPIAGTMRFESLEECGAHDHFICKECSNIIDIHIDQTHNNALKALARKHPELEAEDVIISWQGTCKRCVGGKKYGRKTRRNRQQGTRI